MWVSGMVHCSCVCVCVCLCVCVCMCVLQFQAKQEVTLTRAAVHLLGQGRVAVLISGRMYLSMTGSSFRGGKLLTGCSKITA